MQYSVVQKTEIDRTATLRFDAEYFEPKFLKIINLIENKAKDFISLKKLDLKIDASAFYPALEPYYNKGSLPFIRVQDTNVKIDYDNCIKIPEHIVNNPDFDTLKIVNLGDIVITKGGSIARIGFIKERSATCRDLIFINSSILSDLEYKFLYVYCLTYIYNNLLIRSSSMTAQPHLTITLVKNIPIYNPETKFKKFIALLFDKITELDDSIHINYKHAEKTLLKELEIQNWQPKHELSYVKNFSDVNDANRCDAEYFQPKYDEIIEKIKSYPNGWDKLSNIIKEPKKGVEVGSEEYCEEGIPFIRVSNLFQYEINDNNMQYISEKYYNSIANSYQPKKGEILLSKDGTPGIAYYLNETPQKMIPSGGILRLSINNDEYLPEYLTLVLNSIAVQMQAERVSSGALIKHWLVDEIQNTLIPKLEMPKQIEIIEKLREATKFRKQSKQLLEIAKKGVEIAIEDDEEAAISWINEQLSKIGVEL